MKDRRKGHPTGIDLDDESQAKETSEMTVEQHRNYNNTKSSIHYLTILQCVNKPRVDSAVKAIQYTIIFLQVVDIHRAAKQRAKYPPLFTSTSVNSL